MGIFPFSQVFQNVTLVGILKKYYILLNSLIPQEVFSFEQELENVYFLYISF